MQEVGEPGLGHFEWATIHSQEVAMALPNCNSFDLQGHMVPIYWHPFVSLSSNQRLYQDCSFKKYSQAKQ